MRKKIIIGSLLAVFLMMMLPSASAVESNTVKETMKSQYPTGIPDINIEKLKEKYDDKPGEPTCIMLFLLTQLIRLLRIIKFIVLAIVVGVIFLIIRGMINTSSVAS